MFKIGGKLIVFHGDGGKITIHCQKTAPLKFWYKTYGRKALVQEQGNKILPPGSGKKIQAGRYFFVQRQLFIDFQSVTHKNSGRQKHFQAEFEIVRLKPAIVGQGRSCRGKNKYQGAEKDSKHFFSFFLNICFIYAGFARGIP